LLGDLGSDAIGRINVLAMMDDGRVAVGGDDGWIRILDPGVPTSTPTNVGKHDKGPVHALAVNGTQLVSGGHDHRVLLWNIASPGASPTEVGRHDGAVRSIAVHTSGYLISGGDDGKVLMTALPPSGIRQVEQLGRHSGSVRAIVVRADGNVVTAGDDKCLRVWSVTEPGNEIAHSDVVDGRIVALAAAQGRVLTGDTNSKVYCWKSELVAGHFDWEAPDESADPIQIGLHRGPVRAIAIVGGERVVSGGADGRIRVWPLTQRAGERSELGSHYGSARSIAISSDMVLSSGDDNRVRIWDLREAAPRAAEREGSSGVARATTLLFNGDVLSGGQDGGLWLWSNRFDLRPIRIDRNMRASGRQLKISSLVSLDSSSVACSLNDGSIGVWTIHDASADLDIEGRHYGAVIARVSDDQFLTGGYDGLILSWIRGRQEPTKLGRVKGAVASISSAADGMIAVGTAGGEVSLWNTRQAERPIRTFDPIPGRLNTVSAFSDVILAGGDSGIIYGWSPVTGRRIVESQAHDGWCIDSVALPNRCIVTAGTDDQVILWSVSEDGAGLVETSRVTCAAHSLAAGVSVDGSNHLVVAHTDSGLSQWLVDHSSNSSA
jgi:WD40 repeat protein